MDKGLPRLPAPQTAAAALNMFFLPSFCWHSFRSFLCVGKVAYCVGVASLLRRMFSFVCFCCLIIVSVFCFVGFVVCCTDCRITSMGGWVCSSH